MANLSENEDALLLFIKNPEPGRVKTRLARTVGNERALQIYLALCAHTREVALSVPVMRLLYYSNFIDQEDDWPSTHFQKRQQAGEDLGERMDWAFREALAEYRRVVVIGSDCPELSAEILEEAFEALESHDCVLGPASDGGYYLLGLTKPCPFLFENMQWSIGSVRKETLQRMEENHLTCHLLPELSDVDYEEDWNRLGWEL